MLRNRPYLTLILLSGLFGLSLDFFLIGTPVFVLDRLHAPTWLPGAILFLLTVLTSAGGTIALRLTRGLTRISAMRAGSALFAAWCLTSVGVLLVPRSWQVPYLLAATLVFAAGDLVFGLRSSALAEVAAPPEAKGRYLAAFQYAFTVAQVLAPAIVSLFSVAAWLPWVLVGVALASPRSGSAGWDRGCPRPRWHQFRVERNRLNFADVIPVDGPGSGRSPGISTNA